MAIFQNMTQPQAAPPTPALRDIYRYVGRGTRPGDTPYSRANNTEMDDQSFYGGLTGDSSFDYLGGGDQGPRWGIRSGSFLENLNKEYGGIANLNDRGSGTSQERWSLGIDTSKLPKTKFGDVTRTMAVDDTNMKKIINPKLVYDDPVYGKITHISNYKRDKFLPMLPAIVGMGMGGMLGAAGLAGNGLSTAQSLMRAGSGLFTGGNPLAAIANMALGQVGIPANLRPFVNMAISQLTQRRGG